VSLEGGEETRVFDRGVAGQLFVTQEGIYFVTDATEAQEISFFNFANEKTMKIVSVKKPTYLWGLGASPDGKWILYTEYIVLDNDIMLVENFQ